MHPEYIHKLETIDKETFNQVALDVFRYQSINNPVYARFINLLRKDPEDIQTVEDIPFLPIQAFKKHRVVSGEGNEEIIFSSSGTTGQERSRHFVLDTGLYECSFKNGFKHFYGNPEEWCFLALLPSYMEREGSSLIYMMDHLIKESKDPDSGFYLEARDELIQLLRKKSKEGKKTLLLGVSFALLDLAESLEIDLKGITVMETGGFKGRRNEISRNELHAFLEKRFNLETIHSEYGMTELLSQAYSKEKGLFNTPPWCRVLIRNISDPLEVGKVRKGGINVIDLANYNSCSFIATDDLGELTGTSQFTVSGRIEASDLRGCNLLVSD